jgi:hypothetical protein
MFGKKLRREPSTPGKATDAYDFLCGKTTDELTAGVLAEEVSRVDH